MNESTVTAVLKLFETELAEVKFPGVDIETLQLDRKRVQAAEEQLARAEEAVGAARESLARANEALRLRAMRAMAYARVYAEDEPPLRARLEQLMAEPGSASGSVARALRPRKRTTAPLFTENESAHTQDSELTLS